MRLGRRPQGFAMVTMPIGNLIDFDASIRRLGETYLYASLILGVIGFLHALPRDGKLLRTGDNWTENNNIDPEDVIRELGVGVHLERVRWAAHLNFWFGTDSAENSGDTNLSDPISNFGILIVEWRY